ncbi:hypothetical protein P3W85_12865 [Cupriavidus basilensis]|uniref:DUF3077 domain-containing protein n=1 Tax=Cupriavidus basilensis TaxID=68895 RepID=A0ABT6AN58_9BURK|nr:hypothetical protein [Cupriavidus basilensis]MDF3833833.1 hypothetical protein [Cupriavidus basilensis]
MCKHTRYGVTAEHTGADMFVTAHTPCENPLSLAGEKAAQLYALLFMTCDNAAAGAFGDLAEDIQGRLLSLAAGLAHETLVLSELAARHDQERRQDG